MTILASGWSLQPAFELLDGSGRRLDAGAFRQAHLHQHFGTVGGREELLLDGAHADDGKRESDATTMPQVTNLWRTAKAMSRRRRR